MLTQSEYLILLHAPIVTDTWTEGPFDNLLNKGKLCLAPGKTRTFILTPAGAAALNAVNEQPGD